jgi:chromosome segregation ATPase
MTELREQTSIEEARAQLRQRRSLEENVSERRAEVTAGQREVQAAATALDAAEGDSGRLATAMGKLTRAAQRLTVAREELGEFVARCPTAEEVDLREKAALEQAEQERISDFQRRFGSNLQKRVALLDQLWDLEQEARALYAETKAAWPQHQPSKPYAAGLTDDVVFLVTNGLFETANPYTGQISPGEYFVRRGKTEAWLSQFRQGALQCQESTI